MLVIIGYCGLTCSVGIGGCQQPAASTMDGFRFSCALRGVVVFFTAATSYASTSACFVESRLEARVECFPLLCHFPLLCDIFSQRATAGRATPRPRKAKKGATAAAVSARQGSACQKGSVAPNASPGTEGPASTVNRRRRVRPALARWRRKNAEMLAAVRASCEQTGPDLLP